ncbi:MAG TPA: hypothetical protein VMD97_07220 [Candidatus Aquilonibacter sp.]|nr:hypothetical protein [Candidatus Aquilonibacter sp.]
MRFRPRHYILIAIILALGLYNLYRMHRPHATRVETVNVVPAGPVSQSPSWQAFDKAAALRDAPDAQFEPVLQQLHHEIDIASAKEKPDLDGCQTWLIFYRQNSHAAANDPWRQRSTQHLNNCVSQHRDISS